MSDQGIPRECLFCKVVAKKIPAFVVYEDDSAMAFLDIHPRAPGHAMVMPKYHADRILNLPDQEIGPLFAAVKRAAVMLEKALSPDGITIGINQGGASGQEVNHIHVHLMPRFFGDGGGPVQSLVHNAPKETVEEMAKKIKHLTIDS